MNIKQCRDLASEGIVASWHRGIVASWLRGLVHHKSTLYMPSLVKQVYAKKLTVSSKEKILIWFVKIIFGDDNAA